MWDIEVKTSLLYALYYEPLAPPSVVSETKDT